MTVLSASYSNIIEVTRVSSSYASGSLSASFAVSSISSSYSFSSSYAPFTVPALVSTSSLALTASSLNFLPPSSSFSVSASYAPNLFTIDSGSSWNITSSQSTTSSYSATASYALNAGSSGTSLITGSSYPITASFAINSLTASYATSTSQSTTASYLYGNAYIPSIIDLNPSMSAPAWQEGRVFWDSSNHTIGVYNDQSDTTLQVGQETMVRVVAGENIPDGAAVYISSSINTYPLVRLALADGTRSLRYQVSGISTQNISSGSQGFITVQGRINDVNTAAFPAGTGLFLSYLQSGSFIGYPPPQPYERVLCGYCMNQDAVNGKILVDVIALPESVNVNVGTTLTPSITSLGSGSFLIGTGSVNLNTMASGRGVTKNYSLASASFTLTSSFLDANYVCATYNNGNPIYCVETDKSTIDDIQKTLIYTVTMGQGGTLSYVGWDDPGILLANKLHRQVVSVHGIEREDGLVLGESGSRYITLSSGTVWQGVNRFQISASNSATNRYVLVAHSASVWSGSLISQFINDRYDNGTNLRSLTGNRYVVNWVYRGIGSLNTTVVLLGGEHNKIADAIASQPPTPPTELKDIAVLCGRAIFQHNASNAYQIDSAFLNSFTPAGITIHNDLNGLQGGASNEYYHLTADEYADGSGSSGPFLRATGSWLAGTASFAIHSLTASYALNSTAGGTSLTTGSSYPITSSWAQTASYAMAAMSSSTAGFISFVPDSTTTHGILGFTSAGSRDFILGQVSSSTGGISLQTSGSQRIYIDASGNIQFTGSVSGISAGGTSLTTGSSYPITASWAQYAAAVVSSSAVGVVSFVPDSITTKAVIGFTSSTSNDFVIQHQSSSLGGVEIKTSGSRRIYIDASGNIQFTGSVTGTIRKWYFTDYW
jgi:hypothetical protein